MRTVTFTIISLLIHQQSVGQSTRPKVSDSVTTEQNLTVTENTLINVFLDAELKKDRYKYYKAYELFIIEESVKKTKAIDTYLYSLEEWKSMNRIDKGADSQNLYFLDSLQLQKINRELEKEQIYHWKVSDFRNLKVSLYKYEELRTIINSGAYINLPKRLIIFISKPLIINENNTLISFNIGNGESGNNIINHFTVLLRKENNEWKDSGHYEDGVFY
jgi:hypothetical protein